jgi:hypothetical protein
LKGARHPMTKTTRLLWAMGLGFFMGCSLTPGCGGTKTVDYPTLQEEAAVPEYVVKQLRNCAERGIARLKPNYYAILFDVELTEDGEVDAVKIKDSSLGDESIESCMVRALRGMSLPTSVAGLRSSDPAYGGLVAPQSRALMGTPAVLAGTAVALTPIVIVAAGVTVLVGVVIYAMSTVGPLSDKCRKAKEACIKKCTDSDIPTGTYNGDPYFICLRDCMDDAGC